jgi:hypothetical protein
MSKLTVSEPWNFSKPGGGNELHGRIVRQIDCKTLLFKADDEVSVQGGAGKYWLLSARYEDQSFKEGAYEGTVNGSLLLDLPSDKEDPSAIKQNSVFAVIGSLRE